VRVGLGERQWRLGKNDVEVRVVNLWLMGGVGDTTRGQLVLAK
jgi:hypothetical protein